MADRADVIVYYSLQSDYCYFLLDRLLNCKVQCRLDVRPILGRSSAHLTLRNRGR